MFSIFFKSNEFMLLSKKKSVHVTSLHRMALRLVLCCAPLLMYINKFLTKEEQFKTSPITFVPLILRPLTHVYNTRFLMEILLYGDMRVARRQIAERHYFISS